MRNPPLASARCLPPAHPAARDAMHRDHPSRSPFRCSPLLRMFHGKHSCGMTQHDAAKKRAFRSPALPLSVTSRQKQKRPMLSRSPSRCCARISSRDRRTLTRCPRTATFPARPPHHPYGCHVARATTAPQPFSHAPAARLPHYPHGCRTPSPLIHHRPLRRIREKACRPVEAAMSATEGPFARKRHLAHIRASPVIRTALVGPRASHRASSTRNLAASSAARDAASIPSLYHVLVALFTALVAAAPLRSRRCLPPALRQCP